MTFSVMCRQSSALRYLLKFIKHSSKYFFLKTNIKKGEHYYAVYANIMVTRYCVFISLDDMPEIELGSLVFMNVSDFIAYKLNGYKRYRGCIGDWLWNLKIQKIAKTIGETRI